MENLNEIRHGCTAHVNDGFPSLSRLHTLRPARPTFHRAQPNMQGLPLVNRFAGTQSNECRRSDDQSRANEQSDLTTFFHGQFAFANSFNSFTASSTIRSPVPGSAQLCSPVQTW